MRVVLVMFREGGERRSFSLARDITVVGRREDADFRIPLTDVSRKHCRILQERGTLRVEDLGSSNGTFVNGQKIQAAKLNPGDTLQIGPVPFVVQIEGTPADELIRPFTPPDSAAAVAAAAHRGAPGEFDPMDALAADPDDSGEFEILERHDEHTVDDDVIIDMGSMDEKK